MNALLLEAIDRMSAALRYLEHPDIVAMPFAVPTETVAAAMRETIERLKAAT